MQLIFIGFMGSGKTTISQLMGQQNAQAVLDLDREIEKVAGMDIPTIFKQKGEQYFRDLEHEVLAETINKEGILATGGGTPMRPDNAAILKASPAPVVLLRCNTEETAQRIRAMSGDRPIADRLDVDGLQRLQDKRRQKYLECANIVIDTDDLTPGEIVERINKELQLNH